MSHTLLLVAADHFDAFIYDTDQISVIRAGSDLARELPNWVFDTVGERYSLERVAVGGSVGVFAVNAADCDTEELVGTVESALASDPLYRYVPTLVVASKATTFSVAMQSLRARAEYRQSSRPPLAVETTPADPMFTSHRDAVCFFTARRAAHCTLPHADGEKPVSEFTFQRVARGRRLRRQGTLLARAAGSAEMPDAVLHTRLQQTQGPASFEDIANASPHLDNKLAYLYFDGNSFGKVRADSEASKQDMQAFDTMVRESRSQALAALLAEAFEAEAGSALAPLIKTEAHGGQDTKTLLLEPLLWGGDESLLVLPASTAYTALWCLQHAFQNTALGRKGLTHAFGLLICGLKTPVKEARNMAQMLAELGKTRTRERDSWTPAFFHSIDFVPFADMEHYVTRCFGAQAAASGQLTGLRFGSDPADVTKHLATLTRLPRGQVRRLGQAIARADIQAEKDPAARFDLARGRLDKLLSQSDVQSVKAAVEALCTAWFDTEGAPPDGDRLPSESFLWLLLEDAFDAFSTPAPQRESA